MQAARNIRRSLVLGCVSVLLVVTLAACGLRAAPAGSEPTRTLPPPAMTERTPIPISDLPTATPPPTATATPLPTSTPVSGEPSVGDVLIPELGNTGYDVLTYTLDLAIDPVAQTVDGSTTIAALGMLEDLGQISLDFVGFDIEAITVDGVPAAFTRQDKKLFVTLPEPLEEGELFNITVEYSGQPSREPSPHIRFADHLGLTFLGNNTFYVLSQPDGARYWFPANDHPLDKAAFHISLTVPQELAAIANGQLVGSERTTMPDGSPAVTYHWQHNYPMASYLAVAAAGHYLRVNEVSPSGVPLVYYYFPEFEEEYLEATGITAEAMEWMIELFGPYPFESYGQATYYAMGVSMESQTMSLLSYQMLNERTVIHELAHAWFGNWVTPETWADVWRNEGFATYIELLWLERQRPGALEEELAKIEAEVAERAQIYPLDEPPPGRLLAFETYNRGALLVHALRQEMGDEAFFGGLRLFFERYGGANAGHDEFQATLEEAAGFSLDEFFAAWLE